MGLSSVTSGSEGNSGADLPVAGELLGSGLAERAICQVGVKGSKVHPVEDVKELESQLEVDSLRESRILIEVQICLDEVRRTELIGPLIAL